MKESKLLEMQNKIASLTNVMQQLISETMHLRELSVGTLETLKLMKGYDEAIEKLKDNLTNKEKQDGVIEQDTK
jgi:hypothetical protein|tara:strand:+ start:274 stop:495 length:222 start_codon:yes stop_codon:yes gene_type:complete